MKPAIPVRRFRGYEPVCTPPNCGNCIAHICRKGLGAYYPEQESDPEPPRSPLSRRIFLAITEGVRRLF